MLDHLPGVYSLEIQQGNIVTQRMVNQLQPKMTKPQVLFIMGSPMLYNVFHLDRWDYLYSLTSDEKADVKTRLSLFFADDLLSSMQGTYKPEALAADNKAKQITVLIPKRNLDKTIWGKITNFFDDD